MVFRDIAAGVGRARARRKRDGESGELARRRGNERRDGRIGTGDDVGLGEPDDGVSDDER